MRALYAGVVAMMLVFSVASPVVAAPNLGFGGDGLATKIAGTAGYDAQNADTALSSTVGKIINVVLSIMGTLFLGLMVYGGVVWMIARGDEAEITKAKETIKAAVIGMAITLTAYAVSNFVVNSLLKATEGTPVGNSGPTSACEGLNEGSCVVKSGCAWNPGVGRCEIRNPAWGGSGAPAGGSPTFGGTGAGAGTTGSGAAGASMKTCDAIGGECVDPNMVTIMGAIIRPDGQCMAGKTCVDKNHKKQCTTAEAPFTECVSKDMLEGRALYPTGYCANPMLVCVSA